MWRYPIQTSRHSQNLLVEMPLKRRTAHKPATSIIFTKSGQLPTTFLSMHLQREYKQFFEHTKSEADSSEELAAKDVHMIS
jgi:hypothetical protein